MPKPIIPPPPPKDPSLEKFFDVATTKPTRNPSKVRKRFSFRNNPIELSNHQNGRRETTRCSQQGDLNDSPHPYLNPRRSCQSENILNLPDIPPAPAPPRPIPKLTPAQMRLRRAIYVDKFSRIAFPLTFTMLNCTYWYMFYEYI